MAKAKHERINDANFCRLKGWGPGTVVTVNVGISDRYPGAEEFTWRYRITAIGEEAILVRQVYDDWERGEQRWVHGLVRRVVVNATAPALPTPAV